MVALRAGIFELIGRPDGEMDALIQNVSLLHRAWQKADFDLHPDELLGCIIVSTINGDAGVIIDLSGNTVMEAFGQPLRGFWSLDPAFG